jgi:hypothetical protein
LNAIPATAHSGQQGEAVETWLGENVIWVTSIWEVTIKNILIRNLKVHCLKRIIMTLKSENGFEMAYFITRRASKV